MRGLSASLAHTIYVCVSSLCVSSVTAKVILLKICLWKCNGGKKEAPVGQHYKMKAPYIRRDVYKGVIASTDWIDIWTQLFYSLRVQCCQRWPNNLHESLVHLLSQLEDLILTPWWKCCKLDPICECCAPWNPQCCLLKYKKMNVEKCHNKVLHLRCCYMCV